MCQIDRYSEFRDLAKTLGHDAIALVPGPNFTRLYNKSFHSHERPLVIIIPVEGEPTAIVPNLELASFDLLNFEGQVFDWRDQTGYQDAFDACSKHLSLSKIGVEGQLMRVFVHHALKNAYPDLELVDNEREISGLRISKNAGEVEALRKAIQISEQALTQTLKMVRIGQSEKQVESILVQNLFACGAESLSFDPIVAAADNSARPHASARADYFLKAGDALLLDFGAVWGGLVADITRTFFVQEVSDKQRQAYEIVLTANEAGLAASKPKATAHDVDDAATSVLESSNFADYIRTKTGHGLGRAVHEAPYIMRGNNHEMEVGTVYTVEPGLYLLGEFGIRIEDDVLITENGYESLTTFPKTLQLVGDGEIREAS
ncbi:MAG: M24 family metallopeptidase [Alphaproteobacteria bacterium]